MNQLLDFYNSVCSKPQLYKKDFQKILSDYDSVLSEFFKTNGYEQQGPNNEFFVFEQETEVKNLKEKVEKASTTPTIILAEAVDYCYNKLIDFTDIYNLGYISNFELVKEKYFHVTFRLNINKKMNYSNPASEDLRYQEQLKILESLGLKLLKKTNFMMVENSKNNQDILISLLKDHLEAVGISFETIETKVKNENKFVLRDLNCSIPICKLLEKSSKGSLSKNISELLSTDERTILRNLISDFYNAYQQVSLPELKNTCLNLMDSLFCEICQRMNVETSLRKNHDKLFEKVRKLTNEKELLMSKLEDYINNDVFQNFERVKAFIEKQCLEKLGFVLQEIKITKFSNISIKLKYQEEDDIFYLNEDYEDVNLLSEEKLKSLYETIGTSRKNCNLYLKGSEKNLEILEKEIIKLFKDIYISNIDFKKQGNAFVISTVSCNLFSLNKILESYKE